MDVTTRSRYTWKVKQNATLDSSFWINAHRAGILSYLLDRYSLAYEPAVAAEMDEGFPSGREFWRLARQGSLTEVRGVLARVQEYGAGERAAMNLVLEHPDWLLLLDDQRPFQLAMQLGLKVVCTPTLVISLLAEGVVSAEEALFALARLAALQTVSPHLLAAALAQLGRILKSEEQS